MTNCAKETTESFISHFSIYHPIMRDMHHHRPDLGFMLSQRFLGLRLNDSEIKLSVASRSTIVSSGCQWCKLMVINYRAEGVRKNRHAEGSTGGHPAFFSHWSLIGSFPKIGFESTIHAVCRKKKRRAEKEYRSSSCLVWTLLTSLIGSFL